VLITVTFIVETTKYVKRNGKNRQNRWKWMEIVYWRYDFYGYQYGIIPYWRGAIEMKRLRIFNKNKKDFNLRDWMIISTIVNVGICLVIVGIFSFFYGRFYINVGFLGLFGYMMLFSLYVKTSRFIWFVASVIAIGYFFGYLLW
jgi:hypothetical protein